jgi:hypothetical protein
MHKDIIKELFTLERQILKEIFSIVHCQDILKILLNDVQLMHILFYFCMTIIQIYLYLASELGTIRY